MQSSPGRTPRIAAISADTFAAGSTPPSPGLAPWLSLISSARTGAAFDGEAFTLRLVNAEYRLTWPNYTITADRDDAFALKSLPARLIPQRLHQSVSRLFRVESVCVHSVALLLVQGIQPSITHPEEILQPPESNIPVPRLPPG